MVSSSQSVLVMDDEPHVLDWLVEYLEVKGYKVNIVVNVDEAIDALDQSSFRVAIFDLNVPASGRVLRKLEERGSVHTEYRGLYAAEYARTRGLRGKQVVVYSVHDSLEVLQKCQRIGVQYLYRSHLRFYLRSLAQPTEDKLSLAA